MSGVRASLDLLAERGVDPMAEVYARVFARWPETERLFFRDHDHAIRGHMLFEAIEAVLDMAGDRTYARGYIASERIHHVDDLTVSDEAYVGFFAVLRDVVADALGPAWTDEM
ncbi:MAG: globin, partial [Hyphomonadaceae bacterium]|nr:globin [Hyphomonadaceae bacterium]